MIRGRPWGGDCVFLADVADLHCTSWDFRLVAGSGVYRVTVSYPGDLGFFGQCCKSPVVVFPLGYEPRRFTDVVVSGAGGLASGWFFSAVVDCHSGKEFSSIIVCAYSGRPVSLGKVSDVNAFR